MVIFFPCSGSADLLAIRQAPYARQPLSSVCGGDAPAPRDAVTDGLDNPFQYIRMCVSTVSHLPRFYF